VICIQKESKTLRVRIKFVGGFDRKYQELEIEKGLRYTDLLLRLRINPETVVIVKDNTPVPTDDLVEEGEIIVMRVISGGL